jgi:Domain of unknown function (DUF4352)
LVGGAGVVLVLLLLVVGVALLGSGGRQAEGGQPADQGADSRVEEPEAANEEAAQPVSATSGSSASASASAIAGPEQAEIECSIGRECNLGTGTVLVEKAQKTNTLTADYMQPKSGNYVVVQFRYTYNGNKPITTGEIPWMLTDGQGRSYQFASDETIEYSNVDESIMYEDINPSVAKKGKAIFAVAPDADDFTLTITDLATPQAGKVANLEL